ncbi:MAG TPA: hypothetical protein VN131_00640 [Mobilitalea sp.]|nr:hypothetical protein [Mobilitalea sp.]
MSELRFEDEKKPFYKKWWVWLLFVIVILIFIVIAVQNSENNNLLTPDNTAKNTAKNTPDNSSNSVTQEAGTTPGSANTNISDYSEDVTNGFSYITAPEVRDNSSAVLTKLKTGVFTVGKDIPAGRYVITGDRYGNLFIKDPSGLTYTNEILGGGDLGVDSVTTDIHDGDTIQIQGVKNVTFTPAKTVLYKDTLTTGTWVVGLDIAQGSYIITSPNGSGNLFIYDNKGVSIVNEILGKGDVTVDKVNADLVDGFKIEVSGMKEIKLTAK